MASDNEAFTERGLLVAEVVAGGMAASAGVQGGDHISKLGGCALGSLRALAHALREAGAHNTVELCFSRGSEKLSSQVPVQGCPLASWEGQEHCYEELAVPGARLRVIITQPQGSPCRGVILFLQGIACESVDYAGDSEEPVARLLRGWADAGFATMRVDKRGVGDSEGGCCSAGDFATELADHRAALEALATDSRFADLDIFLFGHSIGGMVAPILARERRLAGVMVYGTSTRNWLDCVLASTRRQLELRGMPQAEVEATLGSLRARVARDGLNGRSAAYHRQLDVLDLRASWRDLVDTRVLVLCGQNDWVLSRDEQMEIAELVSDAEYLELAGLDHMLGWHASRADSLSAYGQGSFREEILSSTLEWLGRCGLHSAA